MAARENSDTTPAVPSKGPGCFRLLHTADWHLGKLLGEHSREEEHRRFLEFLLDAVRSHSVDALVVAGDVFDSANPPQRAMAQYYDFLSALHRQGGCSVILVAGNHDSPAHLEAPRQILKALGAHVIGSLPEPLDDALVPLPDDHAPRVVVAAIPFLRDRDLRLGQPGQGAADIQRDLVAGIRRRYQEAAEAARTWTRRGTPVVATGHLTVAGAAPSESEREIHVGGLGAVGADCFPDAFAYVALGHLHHPQAAAGRDTVRYAGSPIPLSFSEARDTKTLRVLDFADGRLAGQAALPIPAWRPLAQIVTRRASLEADLERFRAPAGDLPAWLEVVIEDPVAGEDLYQRARDLARDRQFELIRVLAKPGAAPGADTPPDETAGAGDADLLADPARVFERRLKAEAGLDDAERESLRTIFRELLDLHADRERQGELQETGGPTPGASG